MNNYNNSNMGQGFDNFNVNNQGDNSLMDNKIIMVI